METVDEDKQSGEALYLSDKRSGVKRVSNDEEEDLSLKKIRVSEEFDEKLEALHEVGNKEAEDNRVPNEGLGDVDDSKRDGKKLRRFNLNDDDTEEDFDLNVEAFEPEENVEEIVREKEVEVIDIVSDEEVISLGLVENIGSLSLGLSPMWADQEDSQKTSSSYGRTYSRADKGKAKVDDNRVPTNLGPSELEPKVQESINFTEPTNDNQPLRIRELGFESEKLSDLERLRQRNKERTRELLRQNARKFARSSSRQEDDSEGPVSLEGEAYRQIGSFEGLFFTGWKMVRAQNVMYKNKPLIDWRPSNNKIRAKSQSIVPSLLEMSLKVLAENAMAIVSLECLPNTLRRRLTDLLCNLRIMNSHILELLVQNSPTEIRIKDCHWLTEDELCKTFRNLDMINLAVLQLDLCGQCNFDYVLGETLARTLNSLPNLVMVSLRGACRLSDDAIKTLVTSAPALQSLNLCQCSLLTETGINFIADSLGSILKELFLDECQKIDAMLIVPALWKFKHLEVLSLAGIETVCDQFVSDIVSVSGQNLKELNFADCLQLSNHSMKYISSTCVNLRSLNISKLDKLTDVGLEYLADGCRSIETLILQGNRFSDEAIAAFLETSGKSMKYLSLNNVSKVGESTALSLLKCSPNLLSLDLSWCRRITNEALVLIVDSCLSLRLIKLFGCTQITDAFLNGHSNTLVRVVGLPNTPLLENMNLLDPEEVLLRYSPIDLPSSSNT